MYVGWIFDRGHSMYVGWIFIGDTPWIMAGRLSCLPFMICICIYICIYTYIYIYYIYVLYVYSKYKKDFSFNFFSTLFCFLLFRKNIMNS